MRSLTITASAGNNFDKAKDAAKAALKAVRDELSLVGWYDAANETGGPLEACGEESAKCVKDYASSHGADYHVKIDGGNYEFYFAAIPDNVSRLNREAVLKRHANLTEARYDNIQGG